MKSFWQFSFLLMMLFSQNLISNDFNFRKTKWGMSMKEVIASESLKTIIKTSNILAYTTLISNRNVDLGYLFINDKLVKATYILSDKHSNQNDYIDDYMKFKELLIKKYGKEKEDIVWKNNLFKDDPSSWGLAVASGELVYRSFWKTSDTNIYLVLGGDNYKITCAITYKDKKSSRIEDEINEKKSLNNL